METSPIIPSLHPLKAERIEETSPLPVSRLPLTAFPICESSMPPNASPGSCSNHTESSGALWNSYLTAIKELFPAPQLHSGEVQSKFDPAQDISHEQIRNQAEQALALIETSQGKPTPLPEQQGAQADALLAHVKALIKIGAPKTAMALLKGLLERELLGLCHKNRTSSLWMEAATASMDSLEAGMSAYTEACRLGLQGGFENIVRNDLLEIPRNAEKDKLSEAFCHRLVECIGDKELSAQTAEAVAALVLYGNPTEASKEALSQVAIRHYQSQKDLATTTQFHTLIRLGGAQAATSYFEGRLELYLEKNHLWAAVSLFSRTLALEPSPISSDRASEIILVILKAIRNDERPYVAKLRKDLLQEVNVKRCLMEGLKNGDLDTCAALLTSVPESYPEVCDLIQGLDDHERSIDLWIQLVDKLDERRSSFLHHMIQEAPHKVAGGLFPSLDTYPIKQGKFFSLLIKGALKAEGTSNTMTCGLVLALNKHLRPLFNRFQLLKARFDCNLAMVSYLVKANEPLEFTLALAGVSEVIILLNALLAFLASPSSAIAENSEIRRMIARLEKPLTDDEKEELTDYCTERLKSAEVHSLLGLLGRRIKDINWSGLPETKRLSLEHFWICALTCDLPTEDVMMIASHVGQAGISSHLPAVANWLTPTLDSFSDAGTVPDPVKAQLYPLLKLLAQHHFGGNYRDHPVIKACLNPREQHTLLDLHYACTLATEADTQTLLNTLKALSNDLSALFDLADPTSEQARFPVSVLAAIEVCTRLACLESHLEHVNAAEKILFPAIPGRYYRGQDYPSNGAKDFSLFFTYIESLLHSKPTSEQGFKHIRTITWFLLVDGIRKCPKVNAEDRQKLRGLVETFIAVHCDSPANDRKNIDGTSLGMAKFSVDHQLFDTIPDVHHLLATGSLKRLKRHRSQDEVIQIYLDAISLATQAASEQSVAMAYQLSLELNRQYTSPEEIKQFIPSLDKLIEANMCYPTALLGNDLASNTLMTLRQSWLKDQPLEKRQEIYRKHMELFAKTFAVCIVIKLDRFMPRNIMIQSVTKEAAGAAVGFVNNVKSALEEGLYADSPELFFAHLQSSLKFYSKLVNTGSTIRYVVELLTEGRKYLRDNYPEFDHQSRTILTKWNELTTPSSSKC